MKQLWTAILFTAFLLSLPRSADADTYSETLRFGSFEKTGIDQHWSADDDTWALDLPFSFPFFDNSYTQCFVDSNGRLFFDPSDTSDFSPSTLELINSKTIAVLWADLRTDIGNGTIFVSTNSQEATVCWRGVYYGSETPINISVTLKADGLIIMKYGAGNKEGGMIAIGNNLHDPSEKISVYSQSGSMALGPDIIFGTFLSDMSGRVLSGSLGVPDAVVWAVLENDRKTTTIATTDDDGSYSFTLIPDDYLLKVSAHRYADTWYSNAQHISTASEYNVPSNASITGVDFELVPGQSPALVYVTSAPTGATVYVDYQPTTNTTPVFLNVGEVSSHPLLLASHVHAIGSHSYAIASHVFSIASHTITINKNGQPYPAPQNVVAVEAETIPVHFDLNTNELGGLEVDTGLASVEAFVDYGDVSVGLTPIQVGSLMPGSHTVILRDPAYLQVGPIHVQVEPDQVTTVDLSLAVSPAPALDLSVESIPHDAEIYVNYLLTTGVTDAIVGELDSASRIGPGWIVASHTIHLRKHGYLNTLHKHPDADTTNAQQILFHLIGNELELLDNDNDGLPDQWEDAYGISTNSSAGDDGADGDFDNDGMSNSDELAAGTNPASGDSVVRFDAIAEVHPGMPYDVTWRSIPGRSYIVQYAEELPGAWVNASGVITATSSITVFTDNIPTESVMRSYRVLILP